VVASHFQGCACIRKLGKIRTGAWGNRGEVDIIHLVKGPER